MGETLIFVRVLCHTEVPPCVIAVPRLKSLGSDLHELASLLLIRVRLRVKDWYDVVIS